MLDLLLLGAALIGAPGPIAPDTIVELRRGDRIVVENLNGELSVGTWDQDQLQIVGTDGEAAMRVVRSGSTLRVTRDDGKGRQRSVDATIRVPPWVDVEIGGRSVDVRVEGVGGRLDISNVDGDIFVINAGGVVDVRTVAGEIDISGASDGVRASSQSEEVRLHDVRGPITVHSGSGSIELIDIISTSVRAETQNGDIRFSGTVDDDGEYGFFVHDGDAVVEIPETSNARVSVSTFDGEFESEFPVRIERFTGGREFDFSLGAGGARIQIQVFDGEIRLLQRR
jgi:hypothetical protein